MIVETAQVAAGLAVRASPPAGLFSGTTIYVTAGK